MSIDYATAGDILERYGRAWETFDGDAWVELFTEHAEYVVDPFEDAIVGHNPIRAYLLDASRTQRQVEFTVERHWVSGTTILATWRALYIHEATNERVRIAGFLTMELTDGLVARLRQWTHRRTAPGGEG